MEWGKFNLVHSAKEKMLKVILKDGMIGRAENQAFEPGLAQDINRMR
jgi:hypothetical protein